MRALVLLTFSLYHLAVVWCEDQVLLSGIVSELKEMKSILHEQKAVLEALKKQGETNGNTCNDVMRYELNELKSTVAGQKFQLEALVKELADEPKVAFSASLFGHGGQTVGGHSSEEILKFKKVFTNIGDAYSHSTGKFTAPVKGVYYFGFSAFANEKHSMGVHLRKNGEQVVATYDYNSNHKDVNGANRAVLMLEKGDEVNVGLWRGLHIFDSYNSVTTFSGFLIFPL